MALAQLFDENLVFCLHAENQEDPFHQVADLLEEEKDCNFFLSKRFT